jgi:hypothetical protein
VSVAKRYFREALAGVWSWTVDGRPAAPGDHRHVLDGDHRGVAGEVELEDQQRRPPAGPMTASVARLTGERALGPGRHASQSSCGCGYTMLYTGTLPDTGGALTQAPPTTRSSARELNGLVVLRLLPTDLLTCFTLEP